MKKCMTLITSLALACAIIGSSHGKELTLEQGYSSPYYKVSFYDRYQKDCGLKNLYFTDKRIMPAHCFYGNIEKDKASVAIKELPGKEYSTSKKEQETTLTFSKDVTVAKDVTDVIARVTRVITCKPSEINVMVTFMAKKELAFNKYRQYLCCDGLSIQVKPFVGATVVGRKGDERDMSLLEATYNKAGWGVNGYYNEIMINGEKESLIIKGGENCEILFSYYCDSYFSLQASYYRHNPNKRQLVLSPGEKLQFSYRLIFERN